MHVAFPVMWKSSAEHRGGGGQDALAGKPIAQRMRTYAVPSSNLCRDYQEPQLSVPEAGVLTGSGTNRIGLLTGNQQELRHL